VKSSRSCSMKARPRRRIASRKSRTRKGSLRLPPGLDGYLFQGDGMPSDPIDQSSTPVRAVGAPVEPSSRVPSRMRWPTRCLIPGKRPFTRSSTWRGWPGVRQRQRCAILRRYTGRGRSSRRTGSHRQDRARHYSRRPCCRRHQLVDRDRVALHSKTAAVPDLRERLCHRSRRAAGCALLDPESPIICTPSAGRQRQGFRAGRRVRITKRRGDDADERFQRPRAMGARQDADAAGCPHRGRAKCSTRSTMRASSAKTRDRKYVYVATGIRPGLTQWRDGPPSSMRRSSPAAKANGRRFIRRTASPSRPPRTG